MDLPGRDPHWRRWNREEVIAWAERREVATLARILESVRRRTMTQKEEGECNNPTIGSYHHYQLSPNGIPSVNQM